MRKTGGIKNIKDLTALRLKLTDDIENSRLTLAEATRAMRKISGMTQLEYAQLLKISPRILIDIENSHGNPRLTTLNKLAGPFGLEVSFIKQEKLS